jgi:hypothetical protein
MRVPGSLVGDSNLSKWEVSLGRHAETSILAWSWHCLTLCRETEKEVTQGMEARELSKWKE